jgi:NAD-dependent dihydropyrimidine dehydrogenase PreA subunit
MAYAIGAECIDVMDRTCVDVCPVECIYEGGRKLYIHPTECIDCGACVTVCPVDAIRRLDEFPEDDNSFALDNETFFSEALPERDAPIGDPGGVSHIGVIGVDTELVRDYHAS